MELDGLKLQAYVLALSKVCLNNKKNQFELACKVGSIKMTQQMRQFGFIILVNFQILRTLTLSSDIDY